MVKMGPKNPYRGGSKRILKDILCEFCRKQFRPKGKTTVFCSEECKYEGLNLRSILKILDKFSITENDCWEWTGRLSSSGYACSGQYSKHSQVAHKVIYSLFKGEVNNGLQLDHLCRNRKCVNPDHLEAVLPIINVQRGLSVKLNNNDVAKIFELSLSKKQTEIAKIFGINQGHISKILNKKRRINFFHSYA